MKNKDTIKATVLIDAGLWEKIEAERKRMELETGIPRIPVSSLLCALIARGIKQD